MIHVLESRRIFFTSFFIRVVLVFVGVSSLFLLRSPFVQAANLYFSPSSHTYTLGQTFTVGVFVGSSDQAVNAYSATLTFPTDRLEFVSLNKTGSQVSLWVQEPIISPGQIFFEGATLNPGYTGAAGKLLNVVFRAKAVGTAAVHFSGGAVLANDGLGTNVLSAKGSGTYSILPSSAVPVPPVPVVPGIPQAPHITSPTHPDPTQWYSSPQAVFQWSLESGIDGVSLSIDQQPTSDPGMQSDGLWSSYTLKEATDGRWYVHLRVHTEQGWSPVSHFLFQVDTQPPDFFTLTDLSQVRPVSSSPAFLVEAQDVGSGIDYYEMQIDKEAPVRWDDDGTHIYVVPQPERGAHTLRARAVDKAGNSLEAQATYGVSPLRHTIRADFSEVGRDWFQKTLTFLERVLVNLQAIAHLCWFINLALILLLLWLWRRYVLCRKKDSEQIQRRKNRLSAHPFSGTEEFSSLNKKTFTKK